MVQKIAKALLIRTFEEISAVISLGEGGQVLGVQVFHSRFGGEWMRTAPDAKEVWMMSNHPQGGRVLSEADMINAARLREGIPFTPLRVFVTGEDVGVQEVAL